MKKIYDPIYKFDTRGKVREWRMEQDGSRYRTHSGLQDGKKAATGWTQAEATNVGKANERDPVTQATFEIEAEYKKKLDRDYHRTVEGARGGAHFFEPMLAEKYKKFVPGFAQPKLDGIRCITKRDGLWSRQGKPIMAVPHIHEAMQAALVNGSAPVFDGELYNHDLKDDFDTLTSIVRKQKPSDEDLSRALNMQYHIYDSPSHPGNFEERWEALFELFRRTFGLARSGDLDPMIFGWGNGYIRLVPTHHVAFESNYDDLHGLWLQAGYEGSMWRANTPYEQKRTKALQKRKQFLDDEFEVVRIEAGNGNWAGVAKRVVCKLPDGREFGAGIKGNRERAAELLHETHKVVTIKYFALTPDGIPRFPVATYFHGKERTL